uniref:RAB7A interacting MON1-CCZ1 complex subunit 1 n=1 Tax=Vombatus ursinus TaxID=29139 RepID=A0A4X2JQ14_VOMUR
MLGIVHFMLYSPVFPKVFFLIVLAKVLNNHCTHFFLTDIFLIKAATSLEKLKVLCKEDEENINPSILIKLYTQAILDMTYFEENKLVDEDFPEDTSLQKVKELITVLSEPEVVVKESNLHPKHSDILGTELLECLYWRRGALLYMYCHTVTAREEWHSAKRDVLKKCLIDGISYLLKMFNFRCPLQLNEDVSFQDIDTAKLLSAGVFSDTHLLAMMYSGEMCYWGLKYCVNEEPENCDIDTNGPGTSRISLKESLDFREIGEKILRKYMSICEGPLKGQSWNTTNAKKMLDFFQHCHY